MGEGITKPGLLPASFLTAALLTGCASTAQNKELVAKYQATIPECSSGEDCEIKWAAARRWVQMRAGLRIENYDENYIQTHKHYDFANTALGVEVTREPIGSGRYQIVAKMWVNNFLAEGDVPARMVEFNDYVNSASAANPSPPIVRPVVTLTPVEASVRGRGR